MAKKLSRTHEVLLKVTFNKACSETAAVAAVKDNVHGVFYPTANEDRDPDQFTVRGAKRVKAARPLPAPNGAVVTEAMIEAAKKQLFKAGLVDTFTVKAALEAALAAAKG